MYSTVYKFYLNKRFSKEILKRHDSPSLEKCPRRQITLLDRLCAQMLKGTVPHVTAWNTWKVNERVTWWTSTCGRGRSHWKYWGSFYNAMIQSFLGLLPLLTVVSLNHPQPSLPPQRTSFTCKDTKSFSPQLRWTLLHSLKLQRGYISPAWLHRGREGSFSSLFAKSLFLDTSTGSRRGADHDQCVQTTVADEQAKRSVKNPFPQSASLLGLAEGSILH